MSDLQSLLTQLNYQFISLKLLETALCHRSVGGVNNERLEFLGDAVLGMVMADELYRRYPTLKEGELSCMRSALVNRDKLASLANSLNLQDYIQLGPGERKSGGHRRSSTLADAMEAVIGAIFLDGGIKVCHQCIVQWFDQHFESLSELTPQKDAKSNLQEWLQARQYPLPTYQSKITGRAHAQTFHVTCQVDGLAYLAEGESSSRRRAEQQAAEKFLVLLRDKKSHESTKK